MLKLQSCEKVGRVVPKQWLPSGIIFFWKRGKELFFIWWLHAWRKTDFQDMFFFSLPRDNVLADQVIWKHQSCDCWEKMEKKKEETLVVKENVCSQGYYFKG